MSEHSIDSAFRSGDYQSSIERLRKGIEKQGDNGKDLLLYLLDLGIVLHTVGQLEESNQVFLKADQIADVKDYTSLLDETGTLLVSDNSKDYKGEDFEKVLINTYLAMNYSLMGDIENALVEARRVNHKLQLMVTQGGRKYKQNAFARYLSAILYEAEGDFNSAYIEYKMIHDLIGSKNAQLGRDLWRTARMSRINEDLEKWDSEYGLKREDHQQSMAVTAKDKAEIIVFFESGLGPEKRPHPNWHSIPQFVARQNNLESAEVEIEGKEGSGRTINYTTIYHNIETTAIANLDEKYAALIAKKVAGVVAKEVVGDSVGRMAKNEGLGQILKLLLYVSDQADLRSWALLPQSLQVARFVVSPGLHTVKVKVSGQTLTKVIQVAAQKKAFVSFRSLP